MKEELLGQGKEIQTSSLSLWSGEIRVYSGQKEKKMKSYYEQGSIRQGYCGGSPTRFFRGRGVFFYCIFQIPGLIFMRMSGENRWAIWKSFGESSHYLGYR